jgi:Holliday junction resolvase-like predicted endonuclease
MNLKSFTVIKASGSSVPFDIQKLRHSLENAGANEETIESICMNISAEGHDGMTTQKIYKNAYAMLRKITGTVASKYRLKKAIIDLGPSGYPFEKFVAELLKYQGYETTVNQIVQGHCITHEVDVIARKKERQYMVECKFHRNQGRKSDVKTALYIQSRFLDVKKVWSEQEEEGLKAFQGWIVTNTRFTDDAYTYGRCMGLKLISWDYPVKGSLKARINMSGLHPITCLISISKKEKEELLNMDIVLCKQLTQHIEALDKLHISNSRQKRIMKEVNELCQV